MDNPIGDTPPEPSEIPNEFELSILDGTLTEDQKDVLHVERLKMEQEEALGFTNEVPIVVDGFEPEVVDAVKAMKESPPMIISQEIGISVTDVLTILGAIS